jgi:phosphomannomutase/phosphoglucomutase
MTPPVRLVSEPNTPAFLTEPMIAPTGFREYDARWRFPEEINLIGAQAVGLGFAAQLREMGVRPRVAVGCDYRAYSLAVKQAVTLGLVAGGAEALDIGVGVTPMAYFAQSWLDAPAVAMITASHNPNGWTGVKIGAEPPLTHGPEEMARLKAIVLGAEAAPRPGGSWRAVPGAREAYLDDLVRGFRLTRPLKVVCACGNGGAALVAPELLRRLGAEVVELHCRPDYDFPRYNPNPEAMEMLHDMARAVRESGADLALGFDGDGDRCGVVDDEGEEIFADKVGVILARELIRDHPGATFVADVKSTGLFAADPALAGARIDYWKTGHSHMKRRVKALGALAGFEKSGHYFLAPPIGRGYDDGPRVAVELLRLLDRRPGERMSDLRRALPRTWSTPTLSPACPDAEKYAVAARITERLQAMAARGEALAGRRVLDVVTVNGARAMLEGGAWALVRPSSNTPNLVVVCESPNSEAELRAVFEAIDAAIRTEPSVGAYDQGF